MAKEKVILAFELTAEEEAAIKAKSGTKEDIRKASVKKAADFLKGKKKEEADAYITENVTKVKLSKALMSAYIKTYSTEADKEWVKSDFKAASTKTVKKKVTTVVTDANGGVVHTVDKNGKAVPKKARVDSFTGETYETFDLSGARDAFIEHFEITTKANKFVVKPKRTTKVYDEFDDIF